MSLTTRVLIALVAGIAGGLLLNSTDPDLARRAAAAAEPVGTLFINAIRMTVIPLVISSLIAGIASASEPGAIGRIGARGLLIFVILLAASAALGMIVGPPVLSTVQIAPEAAAALRESAGIAAGGAAVSQAPSFTRWLVDLVPANPFRAAADGAMLPLIVFAMAFGLALMGISAELRAPIVRFFRGVAEAMLVLVRKILWFAPIGVFALSLPLVARLGFGAVGALATYVGLVALVTTLFMVGLLYPTAVFLGRVPLREFARAAAPAQAVAFSARSSLAALPAMIEQSRTRLGLPQEITGFFLPLASATFRVGAGIGLVVGTQFVARLYDVPLSAADLVTVALTAMITTFSIPGVPAGSIIAMVPVLSSVGLPAEGMGILLGVDTIPDSFRTTANVTGQMTASVVAARTSRKSGDVDPAFPATPAAPAREPLAGADALR